MTNRRAALAGLAGGLVVATTGVITTAAAVTGIQNPDADLIAACERYPVLCEALNDAPITMTDDEVDRYFRDQIGPALEEVAATPALSTAGLAAKVALVRYDGLREEEDYILCTGGYAVLESLFADIERMVG